MKVGSKKGKSMHMAAVGESLWTTHDVARYLGMSSSWVYKAVEANKLPHLRFGSRVRFDPQVIRRLDGANGFGQKE